MRFPLIVAALIACLAVTAVAPAGASAAGGYNDFDCKPTRSKPAPVVLVHGTFANGTLNWGYMGPQLARRGWCVYALTYGVRGGLGATGDMKRSARQLAAYVKRVRRATGARKVKLVGHSQGGMMPRWYLRFLKGARHVNELVALAPSNHGTRTAVGVPYAACPACAQQATNSSFLRKLNRGREVERGVDYTVLQTRYDTIIVPFRSAFLKGPRAQLTNVLLQRRCPSNRASHASVAFDPLVLQWVVHALRRDGPASPRFRPACG
jgi:triacylglycerol lipase